MSLWKRGRQYWADFTVDGRRYRKRLGTTNLPGRQAEGAAAHRGCRPRTAWPTHAQGPKRLFDAVDAYIDGQAPALLAAHDRVRGGAADLAQALLRRRAADRHHGQGDRRLPAPRHEAGKANRTINMDVGVLSRVLKSCGRWRALADHVRNLPERQRPVGRALTPEERTRLFEAAAANPEWEHVFCAAVVAANTSMRPVEVKHLRRCDVDLAKKLVYVRRSKNETSHRVIPLNASALTADRTDGRTRRPARAHRAGTLPLASLPVGAVRSDAADVEVGHGLAGAARRRPGCPASGSTTCGTR